jgi:peptide/nickel transport system substrate-binding protein
MPIFDRRTQLKARRALRKQRRQMEAVTNQADDDIERLFLKRFSRLLAVRRFVLLWFSLVLLLGVGALWQVSGLDKFYLTTAPVSGGIYREGVIGVFTNANPLFATSPVDSSVSRLLFSSLFSVNQRGELVGDLAQDITVDEQGKVYTVELRKDVLWHDGEAFTAEDVIFTYKTIQDIEARSPLYASWKDVRITSENEYSVTFALPNVLSSFQYALTNGIVPAHLLAEEDVSSLRSNSFNTVDAVGTGPFTLRTLEVVGTDVESRQERIAMNTNQNYHGLIPGLDGIVMRSYRSEDAMREDFDDQVIQSMVGLTAGLDEVTQDEEVSIKSAPLTSSVMVFLNNSNPILNDVKVRQALVHATDVTAVRDTLNFQPVKSDSPFLKSQFSYDSDVVQLPFNVERAKKLLDEAGWREQPDGIRVKDKVPLKIRLVSQSLSEYSAITKVLQQNWSDVGVDVEAVLQPETDIQSGAIARHDYDVLLYGISIGYDPDVFAYWHSSQTDPNAQTQLNLSEYKSDIADDALEAGRTRIDEDLRKIKYKPFLEAWRTDAPAIALYQPRFVMVVRGTFEGFESGQLLNATDRFNSIANWKIRNDQVVR